MSAATALSGRADALRARFGRRAEGERFTDRPYASVQLLLVASAGLLVFGILMAVSTTIAASTDTPGAPTSIWNQVIKEGIFIAIGLPIFWFAMILPPKTFRLLAYPFMALGFLSLVAVLIPGIGFGVYGARRWIDLGPLQLQPSEFAKVGVLLWGADLLARKQHLGTLSKARHLFIPLVPGVALIAGLVMLEPDLGTACCYLLILLGLLWMVGMPMRYFAVMVGLVAGAVTLLAVAAPYRLQRLTSYTDPWAHAKTTGYHAVEGIYALASGGYFGVGLGQGTSKYGWVPNANSDFVFAIIGEELGLLGCLAVLVLFAMFAFTGMRIARRSADPFVRLVAGAATIWICGQAVINVGYVTALLPVTGIPLPFISAGGTSLLSTFFVLGMLVSFARHEGPAVVAARRDERLGRRSRLQRWLRVPVPKAYVPPKRRASGRPATARSTPGPASRRASDHGGTAGHRPPTGARLTHGDGCLRRPLRLSSLRCGPAALYRHRRAAEVAMTGLPVAPRIVVAGGGTAGHIEPAMNLADALRRLDPSAVITALGTEKGLDSTLIPARGYPLEMIPPVPLPRALNRALLATPGRVRDAVAAAGEILDRIQAEVVVGFGGYVAVPAYLAARRRSLPVVVHEANAKPGLANRGAARLTPHVFTASSQAHLPHATVIGIPLRPAISQLDRSALRAEARIKFGLDAERPTLLVFGGSQGARSINWAASEASQGLRAAGVQVLHVIGPKNDLEIPPGDVPYVVVSYVDGMQYAYAAADFALCRCGAMTCAELAAVGLPAAYVPYPVGNGEQRFNAMPIVAAGGGLLVDDGDLTARWILGEVVPRITDPDRLAQMSAAAELAGSRDADLVLARHVLTVVEEHRRFPGTR